MSGRCVGEIVIPDDLAKALHETLHYLSQGSDCFTVSVGDYEISYDGTKGEGHENLDGGKQAV